MAAKDLDGQEGATFHLEDLDVTVVGTGADIEARAPGDDAPLWTADGGAPGHGGRATVDGHPHDIVLTPGGELVVVLVDTFLGGGD